MSPSSKCPHAVVIPFPAQGHIAPMMHLSRKLAAQGFTITFVNTQHTQEILARSIPPISDPRLDIRLVAVQSDSDDGRTTGQDSIVELAKAWVRMEEGLGQLIAKLLQGDTPPTCIVSDLYGAFTQNVATKFGLPRLAFWTASVPTLASVMAIHQGCRPPQEPSDNEFINWVPGAPPLKLHELNTFLQRYDPGDFMFDIFLDPYSRLGETTWIAFNSFEELDREALDALRKDNPHMYTVGPLLPDSYFDGKVEPDYWSASLWPEENECMSWLDKQSPKSVLFVSFGSIATLSREQFEELALGLEASQHPLLWVIRSDLLAGEEALLPDGYLERLKDRVCFVSWAPQLQVLAHEATGGFLTHAGWNSTLEAITAGVPMLGWPYFADQMLNSRCVVDGWKVGLDFEKGAGDGMVGRKEVEKKARQLMEGEQAMELRENARKWKEAAKTAVLQASGSSRLSWEQLLEAMTSAAESHNPR